MAVAFPAWLCAWQVPAAEEIDSTLKELSAITGFRVRHQLPFQLITRDQVNQFLADKIKKSVKPDEIRAEELTLKKFGFVPPDFDLKKTTIDLLTEQAAAFYDYDKKKLFISDWATKNMRDAALIHELAHALADQNYPIAKFLKGGRKSGEESAAREAVVEGQASWLMIEVVARRAGTSLRDPAVARQYIHEQSEDGPGEYPVFDKSPLYLQRTLLFPYDDGMRFQQAVFLHDGADAFARLLTAPPDSTAQVLHPSAYFEKTPFVTPPLEKPAKGSRAFTVGTLGELEISVLLEQFADKKVAAELSPKLKGAAYRIDEQKLDKRSTLIFVSEWKDEASAQSFFDRYATALNKKWRKFKLTSRDPDRITGKSEDGYFETVRRGVKVESREGYASPFANGNAIVVWAKPDADGTDPAHRPGKSAFIWFGERWHSASIVERLNWPEW